MYILKICSSCGKQARVYAEFRCPHCGEGVIVRCPHCRETTNTYRCSKCGKVGP
ncbi:MAG: zinc finger domain-containing protein [Candidatus Micrarchaeota archaeon]|nr:zinc finger domain-containing protein [Candidatus Micrarchaeota archaeon]